MKPHPVTLRLTVSEHAVLKAFAKKHNTSMSRVLAMAVMQIAAKMTAQKKPVP